MKDLADTHFPHAKTIVPVHDNLNIHGEASLYEAFAAAEARCLVECFEWRPVGAGAGRHGRHAGAGRLTGRSDGAVNW